MTTMNLSSTLTVEGSIPECSVVEYKLLNASVTSGYDFHASQADRFPFPKKQDTVSHPVIA
jgi:hypothetical protein